MNIRKLRAHLSLSLSAAGPREVTVGFYVHVSKVCTYFDLPDFLCTRVREKKSSEARLRLTNLREAGQYAFIN